MSWWFYIKALVVLCSSSGQLTRAATLPRYGTGLSPKFIRFSAGSLITIYGLAVPGNWYETPLNLGWHQIWVNTYHGIS
jgi:hypothetical protein